MVSMAYLSLAIIKLTTLHSSVSDQKENLFDCGEHVTSKKMSGQVCIHEQEANESSMHTESKLTLPTLTLDRTKIIIVGVVHVHVLRH